MALQIEERDDVFIVSCPSVDSADFSYDLRDVLRGLFKENKYNIIVDMSSLEMVSSSVLSVLIAAWEKAKKYGGHVLLSHVSSNIRELIHITQLGDFLKTVSTTEEGVKNLQGNLES